MFLKLEKIFLVVLWNWNKNWEMFIIFISFPFFYNVYSYRVWVLVINDLIDRTTYARSGYTYNTRITKTQKIS